MTDPVIVERTYLAPPAEVWTAWMDVDRLTKWWGCAPDSLWDVHEWDTRVDGRIRVSMDFDGEPYEVRGRFLELDEPRVIRYEWEAGQTITMTLEPDGEGSRMTIEHAGLADDEMCQIVTGGWSSSVEQILTVLT